MIPYDAQLSKRRYEYMTTKNTNRKKEKITALYCRLSQDDGKDV